MFFVNLVVDFVLQHWFLVLVYTAFFIRSVRRLQRQTVVCSRLNKRLYYHLIERWKGTKLQIIAILLLCLLHSLIILALLPFGWAIWLYYSNVDAREYRRKLEENERAIKEGYIKAEQKREENLRRELARRDWLAINKPVFYFKTVNGITAVLRPADYEATKVTTQRMRRDGFWEKENVLYPAKQTFVFVTKQGKEAIDANTASDKSRYKVAGLISQFDDIVAKATAVAIKVDDIFLPWINETLVSFEKQSTILHDCVHTGSYYHLVEMQAPEELQPIT